MMVQLFFFSFLYLIYHLRKKRNLFERNIQRQEIGDQAKYFDGFTPYYVPPELAKSQSPSYASDVWRSSLFFFFFFFFLLSSLFSLLTSHCPNSAGILLYATLTGKFPFPEGGSFFYSFLLSSLMIFSTMLRTT